MSNLLTVLGCLVLIAFFACCFWACGIQPKPQYQDGMYEDTPGPLDECPAFQDYRRSRGPDVPKETVENEFYAMLLGADLG